jgi:two-component system phosphate regulon sensor histidine kinase PhoR
MPIILGALMALLLWGIFSAVVAVLFVLLVLLVVMAGHARQLYSLAEWLRTPAIDTIPEADGIWGEVFSRLYKMVKRHKQTKQDLAAELLNIEQATAAFPEGVVSLNAVNRIEWCNPLAEHHFGINASRDILQDVTYLVRQPEFIDYLHAANYSDELVMKSARHDEMILSLKLVSYGADKRLLISRDITQWERVETIRRDFVANVSHELRTPLTVVNGFVENLQDMPDLSHDKIRRALDLMADQTRRMDSLVADLLTLSSLENDLRPLRVDLIDMQVLLAEVYQEGQMLSAGRHQHSLDISGPAHLSGNRNELRSAFGNLVSNAVRYTPDGGSIRLSWDVRDGQAVFSVQDSGIGIEPQHIPRLTERFYRVDRSRSRETGGTGLGLAIVNCIAHRHQARLDIVSADGLGSAFSLAFPVSRIED